MRRYIGCNLPHSPLIDSLLQSAGSTPTRRKRYQGENNSYVCRQWVSGLKGGKFAGTRRRVYTYINACELHPGRSSIPGRNKFSPNETDDIIPIPVSGEWLVSRY